MMYDIFLLSQIKHIKTATHQRYKASRCLNLIITVQQAIDEASLFLSWKEHQSKDMKADPFIISL